MAYFAPEDILRARDMDLLTYLRNYEPQNLVHLNGDNYCTREHDSLKISNCSTNLKIIKAILLPIFIISLTIGSTIN